MEGIKVDMRNKIQQLKRSQKKWDAQLFTILFADYHSDMKPQWTLDVTAAISAAELFVSHFASTILVVTSWAKSN